MLPARTPVSAPVCHLPRAPACKLRTPHTPPSLTLDTRAAGTPLPHFWEQMFGSGRAALALRDDYRRDPRQVHAATGFRYVRFHAILHDELGVYSEDAQGKPVYNWSYVDQIYDGLLADGVRPFVEISFMPNGARLAAGLPRLLVQADRRPAGRLRQVGRPHYRLRPAPG